MWKKRMTKALIGGACLAIIGSASALAGNPPGNNGTVKVDNVGLAHQENANEPHVGCSFRVEWYGFDANAVSTVTFETHPPTSDRVLLTDVVQLDGDDASGGGSLEGFDGETWYNLAFDPNQDFSHPQQGYHVYLTVETTGSQGADVKHKVFWVTGCYGQP